MERVRVDSVELEYEERGSGEPVLLIHGSHIANTFEPLMTEPALGDYRLVRYHRRGLAGSTHTEPPVSIADQAVDAAGLLDHLGVEHAHVVGHSYGGVIGLQLALDRSGLVHSLSLLEPALLAVPSAEALGAEIEAIVGRYMSGDQKGAVEAFLTAVCGPDWRTVADRVLPGAGDQAMRDADTFFQIELPALNEWTFGSDQAGRIRQPVLSILGAASNDVTPLFGEGRQLLHDWFSTVEDFDLAGATHLLQVQNPAGMAQGLAAFFRRHPPR